MPRRKRAAADSLILVVKRMNHAGSNDNSHDNNHRNDNGSDNSNDIGNINPDDNDGLE